jgi:PKD repeat protein
MKYKMISLWFLMLISSLSSVNYLVKQDGSGDFTSIQTAIENASTNGDTIIVFPGRYYENLDYLGKNITVCSLYRYSNNREYIHNTIIDANQQGSGILFMNQETRNAVIDGFTIENGTGYVAPSGTGGGAIHIAVSSPSILNCIIQNNKVFNGPGGAICIGSYQGIVSNPFLSGNVIKNNKATFFGGGIQLSTQSQIEFDSLNKNSIFSNMAGNGYDLSLTNPNYHFSVVLDTFTVAAADPNFLDLYGSFDFQCEHAIYESFINHDVFVSPLGSDQNDGLSPASPFQTIAWALYRIASDSLNPKTIYLAPGTYNRSQNNQFFPLNMKAFVSIEGAGPELTILDCENLGGHIISGKEDHGYKLSNLSIANNSMDYIPKRSTMIFNSTGLEFENLRFSNIYIGVMSSVPFNDYYNPQAVFKANNLLFENSNNIMLSTYAWKNDYSNIIIRNNEPYWNDGILSGPAPVFLFSNSMVPLRTHYEISNLVMHSNESFLEPDWPVRVISNAIEVLENTEARIINSTISHNTVPHEGGPVCFREKNLTLEIYNSIIYGNTPNRIWFVDFPSPTQPHTLSLSHTNLEGGRTSIREYYPNTPYHNTVIWGEGNIDADPLYQMGNEHPYQLGEGSPCIDAGTLDIPDYSFPETDIMGNPRIVGGSIDMGAYEFQGLNANFTATPRQGILPLEVQFTDTSSGEVFAWAWDFDLDGNIDSYEQNPLYTYTLPGLYSVRLVINNGERSVIKNDFIHVEPLSADDIVLPAVSNLSDPYPNPFRGKTLMNMQVNEPGKVNITVYNIKGQKVRKLMDSLSETAYHQIVWDGYDEKGKKASSGIYTIQIKHKNKVVGIKKVTLIK